MNTKVNLDDFISVDLFLNPALRNPVRMAVWLYLLALAHSNQSNQVSASRYSISDATGIPQIAVRNALDTLEEYKLITRLTPPKSPPRKPVIYTLNNPKLGLKIGLKIGLKKLSKIGLKTNSTTTTTTDTSKNENQKVGLKKMSQVGLKKGLKIGLRNEGVGLKTSSVTDCNQDICENENQKVGLKSDISANAETNIIGNDVVYLRSGTSVDLGVIPNPSNDPYSIIIKEKENQVKEKESQPAENTICNPHSPTNNAQPNAQPDVSQPLLLPIPPQPQPPPPTKNQNHATNTSQTNAQALQIYQAYPRKVGKPAALRAISKALKNYPATFLLEKTTAFAKLWDGIPTAHMDLCPHPSTWFNQERFNDDPNTWNKPKTTKPYHPQPANNTIEEW